MRDWQLVVPDYDRSIYEKAGSGQRQPFGKRPALLVVDVTKAFMGVRSENVLDAVETHVVSCGDAGWIALPRIEKLLKACRDKGVPVVYTVPVLGIPTCKPKPAISARGEFGPPGEEEEGLDIPESIAPCPNELVFSKPKASGFFGTWLVTYLRFLRVDCVLVCGTSTSGCVRATAIDAFNEDFTVFVVDECCFDRSLFFHRASLYHLNAKYTDVISLEEALEYLDAVDEWIQASGKKR
ncbi:MAG: isochorismatase family protein [Chloroflexi bacterium]|nr:isochorismatase family protein [Chloroflexota bacterium]